MSPRLKTAILVTGSIAFVAILWYGSFYLIQKHFPFSWAERGQFGDLFGAVNALFSGLAFAGIIYTIYIQQKEIEDNSRELKRQQFESAFFNMLSTLTEIINSMHGSVKRESSDQFPSGRAYLSDTLMEFLSARDGTFWRYNADKDYYEEYLDYSMFNPSGTVQATGRRKTLDKFKDDVGEKFADFFKDHHSNLGLYFRYVYNIIKYVTENFKDEVVIKRYVNLLQAQLSNDELALLFYDAISIHGKSKLGEDKFREWLDEYGVLENIVPDNLLEESHVDFYPKTLFRFIVQQNL